MKSTPVHLLLLSANLFAGADAWAQYNLRTIPTNPPAGTSFLAAFDGNGCEVFLFTGLATPPSVLLQGTTVQLVVDHVTLANCTAQPMTHMLSVPKLAAGDHQLELVARDHLSPD